MATKTNSANGTSTKKQPTAQEMREFYEQNKRRIENFDSAIKLKSILYLYYEK